MDTTRWPYNPTSLRPDAKIQWRQATMPFTVTPAILHAVAPEEWSLLMSAVYRDIWAQLDMETQEAIKAKVEGRTLVECEPLTPVTITSMAARAMEIESARAKIPVEALLVKMMTAVQDGHFDGVPLQNKDRIDMIKFLVNKILPDAKGVDMDDRNRKFDQKRRAASDFTADELAKLPKEALLELLNP